MLSTLVVATAERRREAAAKPAWELNVLKSSQFITGTALASAVSVTIGTAINSDTDWLEFKNNRTGETMVIPKMPLRYNIAVQHVQPQTPDSASKIVTIRGQRYSIQIPSVEEFEELVYSVCTGRPNGYAGPHRLAEYSPSSMQLVYRNMSRTRSGSNYVYCGGSDDPKLRLNMPYGDTRNAASWRPILKKVT